MFTNIKWKYSVKNNILLVQDILLLQEHLWIFYVGESSILCWNNLTITEHLKITTIIFDNEIYAYVWCHKMLKIRTNVSILMGGTNTI